MAKPGDLWYRLSDDKERAHIGKFEDDLIRSETKRSAEQSFELFTAMWKEGVVIGGQAVLLYGEPRLTRDIDITLGVGIDHLDALLQTIKKIPLRALPEDVAAFVQQTMVLPAIDESTGIRVDYPF